MNTKRSGKPRNSVPQNSQPQQAISAQKTEIRHHQGPIPDPETLRRYDDLVPGAATTIINMAVEQAAHRKKLEIDGQESDSAARNRQLDIEQARVNGTLRNELVGQAIGGIVAIGCVGGAIWSSIAGQPWYVIVAFLGLPVGAMIRAITGKR